jgi:hypothetical protein
MKQSVQHSIRHPAGLPRSERCRHGEIYRLMNWATSAVQVIQMLVNLHPNDGTIPDAPAASPVSVVCRSATRPSRGLRYIKATLNRMPSCPCRRSDTGHTDSPSAIR